MPDITSLCPTVEYGKMFTLPRPRLRGHRSSKPKQNRRYRDHLGQGSLVGSINPKGAITFWDQDASGVYHGDVRAPDGTITTFDAPGAGTGASQGTQAANINPAGAITGNYVDASAVAHGFLRAPGGVFTTFDAPGAGTGSLQGTLGSATTRPAQAPDTRWMLTVCFTASCGPVKTKI
jgi:hypothetical protein